MFNLFKINKMKKLLFILLLFSNKDFASVQTRIKADELIEIDSYDTVKESVLNHIKQYEKNHKNVVGLTGYGHKTYSDSIINLSEKQADSLLRIDFEKCIDIVPDSYNEYQKLFVAAFIYNCGRGTFAKCLSGRKRMIDVCRYKEKEHRKLKERRIFEQQGINKYKKIYTINNKNFKNL